VPGSTAFAKVNLTAILFGAHCAAGKGDTEILEWIQTNGIKRTASEIAAWTHYQEQRAPGNVEGREFFTASTLGLRQSGKTSPPGLTFWTWMTTPALVVRFDRPRALVPVIRYKQPARGAVG